MNYTEIRDILNIHLTNRINYNENLPYITHYLQNIGHQSAEAYREVAERFIPNDLDIENITWDVPIPPIENPAFTFIDLFAGVGGLRQAFQNLGGKCLFTSEWDFYAQKSYEHNYGEVPFGDITQIDENFIPNHHILLAGFPCQAFSIAGKRGGFEDTRGTLFFDVARIIRAKRPRAFLLENVKGLRNHDRGRTLNTILHTLRYDLGYYVPDPQIMNAQDFGVPQNRERIFIVGFSPESEITDFEYPAPTGTDLRFIDIRESEPVLPKYYLSQKYLDTLKRHKERHESKGNGFGYGIVPNDGIASAIVVGGMGRERNLVIDNRQTDFTNIPTNKSEINNEGIRAMTPKEWQRLQGFSPNYEIVVSDVQAYKQFGNSVAVPAVQATGTKIVERLFEMALV
jgi:DNA (cytosine-5)-methyltransferase 1